MRLTKLLAAIALLVPLSAHAGMGTCAFTVPTSATTVACTDSNLGGTPVAGIIFGANVTANDTISGDPSWSIGMFAWNAGAGTYAAQTDFADDNRVLGSTVVQSIGNNDMVMGFVNSGGNLNNGVATISAVSANTATLNFTTAGAGSYLGKGILFTGAIEAKVIKCTFTAATSATCAHGLGGNPEVYVLLAHHAVGGVSTGHWKTAIGFYDRVNNSLSTGYWGQSGGANPTSDFGVSSTSNMNTNTPGAGNVDITVTSSDSTNIVLGASPAVTEEIFVLAMRGTSSPIVAQVGNFLTETSTGTAAEVTGMSAAPTGLVVWGSKLNSSSTSSTADAGASWSFGVAASNAGGTSQRAMSASDDDNVTTTVDKVQVSSAKMLNLQTVTSGASDVEATLSSWDSGGVTLDYSNAGATQFSQSYLALSFPVDTTPDNYTYTDVTAQALSSTITSAAITVAGVDAATNVTITVSGSSGCQWDKNNAGSWSSSSGSVVLGDTVKVRVTSSSGSSTATTCASTIGGVSDTFSVTTDDFSPTQFTFVDQTGAASATPTTSAAVTIAGLGASAAAAVTASGDTGCGCSVNAGAYSTSCGNAVNTDAVTARVTSPALNSATANCLVMVGPTIADTFSVTTGAGLSVASTITKLFADVFTNADAALTTHTPSDGISNGSDDALAGGWTLGDFDTNPHGTALIVSNKLSIPVKTVAVMSLGTPNQVVDFDWTPTLAGDNSLGVFLRYSNSSNFWQFNITATNSNLCAGGTAKCNFFNVSKKVAGASTSFGGLSPTSTPALPTIVLGNTYRVLAAANGNELVFGIYISSVWYVVHVTDSALNTVTNAGIGNTGSGSQAAQIVDGLYVMQSAASTDPTTLRIADDPTGFFFGSQVAVGSFHWIAPRSQPDHYPVDFQMYCCGSWYIDPAAAFVGNTVWGIERYNPTLNTITATTHTHTTLDTGTPTAPTLSTIANQTCALNQDPGALDLKTYISNSPQPTPTWDVTVGGSCTGTTCTLTSGRTFDTTGGVITGICNSATGSPVSTTIRATNATGAATASFSQAVTTPTDLVPDGFSFASQSDVALASTITSETITPTGFDSTTTISISNGTYSLNGGAYTAASGSLAVGDTVTVRLTSSALNATTVTATLTMGGVTGTFSATTLLSTPASTDIIPDQFSVGDAPGVATSLVVQGPQFTVLGINASTLIGVTGGEYEVNASGTWTSAVGSVVLNDKVRVRGTSSASTNTPVNVVLSIGGVLDTFTITTAIGASCQNIPNQRTTVGGPISVDITQLCAGVTNFSGTAVTPGLTFSGGVLSGTASTAGHYVEHFQANAPQGSFPVGVTIDVGTNSSDGSSSSRRVIRPGLHN